MFSFLCPSRNPDFVPEVGIARTWTLTGYLAIGESVDITFDASPVGLGALLEVSGNLAAYIESRLLPEDARMLGQSIGSSKGQQTFECLICLVALRAWKSYWRGVRVVLRVRGDNFTALTMLLSMNVRGAGPNLIAREVALELADGAFAPQVVAHLPGVANDLSDALSRRFDPAKAPWSFPRALRHVPRTAVPSRDAAYYLSSVAPPLPA